MTVNGIGGISLVSPSFTEVKRTEDLGKGLKTFSEYFKDALDNTNNLLLESEKLTEDFAAGRTDNIHQVLIAGEKAEIALQFTMQIRNKILDAYNEIMRMQI